MATVDPLDRTWGREIATDSSPVSLPSCVELAGATQAPDLNPTPENGEEDVGREGHWRGVETAASPAVAPVLLPSNRPRR